MRKIITLTAGHSDTDPGACANGQTEAALVEDMRNAVAAHLRDHGYEVRTDGSGAFNLPLGDAMRLIAGSAVAIELHLNAAESPQAGGVEVVSLPRDKYRAQRLAACIAGVMGNRLRGEQGWIDQSQTHRGRLGFVNAGGLIVETFFISNPQELERYQIQSEVLAHELAVCIMDMLEIASAEP
jgi:N-acetylmuramoyl-L-alanine amidase